MVGEAGAVVSAVAGAIVRKQLPNRVFAKAILYPVQVMQTFSPRQSQVIPTVRVTLQWK